MLRRFVAATAVASVAIMGATLVMLLSLGLKVERSYPLAFIWCCAPAAWGFWAALAPPSWVPKRLPVWGAILGLLAGTLGAFVLNLPAHILEIPVPLSARAAGVVVMTAFYFVLWMLVRIVYRALNVQEPAEIRPPLDKAA